jgi:hypothetical protein
MVFNLASLFDNKLGFIQGRRLLVALDWKNPDLPMEKVYSKVLTQEALQLCMILHHYIFMTKDYDKIPTFESFADVKTHLKSLRGDGHLGNKLESLKI